MTVHLMHMIIPPSVHNDYFYISFLFSSHSLAISIPMVVDVVILTKSDMLEIQYCIFSAWRKNVSK